jgi:hypothetical protein
MKRFEGDGTMNGTKEEKGIVLSNGQSKTMPQGILRGWSLRNLSARLRGPLGSETSDVLAFQS